MFMFAALFACTFRWKESFFSTTKEAEAVTCAWFQGNVIHPSMMGKLKPCISDCSELSTQAGGVVSK